eukprot:2067388-Pyramimonas_sp.AAC.1
MSMGSATEDDRSRSDDSGGNKQRRPRRPLKERPDDTSPRGEGGTGGTHSGGASEKTGNQAQG